MVRYESVTAVLYNCTWPKAEYPENVSELSSHAGLNIYSNRSVCSPIDPALLVLNVCSSLLSSLISWANECVFSVKSMGSGRLFARKKSQSKAVYPPMMTLSPVAVTASPTPWSTSIWKHHGQGQLWLIFEDPNSQKFRFDPDRSTSRLRCSRALYSAICNAELWARLMNVLFEWKGNFEPISSPVAHRVFFQYVTRPHKSKACAIPRPVLTTTNAGDGK